MIIKLVGCLEYVENLEKEYNKLLERVNMELEKKGIKARVFLAKNIRKANGKVFVKYLGTRIKIFGEVDVSQITLPSRFPLDGFEYVIEKDTMLCSYKIFRKFANMLKQCRVIISLDNVRDKIIEEIMEEACKVKEYYSKLLKAPVNWVPLIKTGILRKASKTLNINYEDLIDYLAYLRDKGVVKIMFGEKGELWLQVL